MLCPGWMGGRSERVFWHWWWWQLWWLSDWNAMLQKYCLIMLQIRINQIKQITMDPDFLGLILININIFSRSQDSKFHPSDELNPVLRSSILQRFFSLRIWESSVQWNYSDFCILWNWRKLDPCMDWTKIESCPMTWKKI